ncbi:MAG: glycosyl transferase family protein [Pseudomonadota bacterium]
MANNFSQYVQLIGRGKTAGKYLTQEQAYDAMSMVLNNQTTPEQLGAFLMLLRVREESSEELAGFLTACRQYAGIQDTPNARIDLDIGCYAGKRRHLPWSLLAVKLLAQNGYKVLLHGHVEENSTRLYMQQVWEHFNWQQATSSQVIDAELSSHGFAYAPLSTVNPKLHYLINLRHQFGLRSCANTLARMLNPFAAAHSLHGIYHKAFEEKHIKVAELLGEDVICIRGDSGEAEPNPEREVSVHQISSGKYEQKLLPKRLEDWQMKPKVLDPDIIKAVWLGRVKDTYGEAATVLTVALFIIQLKDIGVDDALKTAGDLWEKRERTWV